MSLSDQALCKTCGLVTFYREPELIHGQVRENRICSKCDSVLTVIILNAHDGQRMYGALALHVHRLIPIAGTSDLEQSGGVGEGSF